MEIYFPPDSGQNESQSPGFVEMGREEIYQLGLGGPKRAMELASVTHTAAQNLCYMIQRHIFLLSPLPRPPSTPLQEWSTKLSFQGVNFTGSFLSGEH